MTPPQKEEFKRRLGYILHRGLAEIRSLATNSERLPQIAELADVLEYLPRFLNDPTDDDVSMVRTVLGDYQQRHPNSWELVRYLNDDRIPDVY